MISKAKLKYIRSLEQKKYRRQEGVFVAEGPKVVGDLLAVAPAREVFATREWISQQPASASARPWGTLTEVSDDELRKLSFLQHPQQVLAVFETALPHPSTADDELRLALDGVQDPGNLGTIIRIADWFGIDTIFCSPDTADAYSPKVVQATMGSIARIHIIYTDLTELLDALPPSYPVYGTLLDGDDIYRQQLSAEGLIVMGNEGNGISPAVRQRINRRLLIPSFRQGDTAESLNVAIATAITCSEFRRKS